MGIELPKEFRLAPISDLKPYENNARTHSPSQIAQIAQSIKTFGFTQPILVDGKRGIIAGHGRLAAAKKLGMAEVPVIELTHLSSAQKRAYILADNKLALNAGWDEDLLAAELHALDREGFELDVIGFSDEELKELLADFEDGAVDGDGEGVAGTESIYTKKIEAPIYTPTGPCPPIAELYDAKKADALLSEIGKAEIPDDVKGFLAEAATRHTVFDYGKIAEYYAHAPKEVQELMERSALVIIDFQKAIENGFVVMTKEIAEAYGDASD